MNVSTRLLKHLLGGLSLLVASAACADNFVDGSPIPDYYDEPGFASFREQVASEDAAEAIDPFSGRLHISHVDIDIPGNGGLDLKVIRSYDNIQLSPTENDWGLVGIGWDLHFGRVLLNPKRGICDPTVSNSASDHVLQLPDGSRHILYVPGTSSYSSYLYVTADRWIATCTTAVGGVGQGLIVTSPEGVSYYMTQPYTGMGPGTALAATKIVDRNGNTITINYEPAGGTLGLEVISGVTTSDGRSLTFNYANLNATNVYLSTITTAGYTWTYQYQAVTDFLQPTWELKTVVRPDNSTWQYTYYPGSATVGGYSIQTMTYPHGAVASYTYQNVDFGYPYATVSVSTKAVTGPSMQSANWSYHFGPTSSGDTTTINGPSVTYTYKHVGYMQATNNNALLWEVGCLLEKDTVGSTATQIDSYGWTNQLVASQPMAASGNSSIVYANGSYAPVMSQHIITRESTPYTTTYSNFDSYGNAQTVTENGTAGTRTTTYVFHVDTAKWILHDVLSQTIAGIGTISNTFDGSDNIHTTTRYGVLTTYGHTSQGDIASVENARNYTTNYSSYARGIAQTINEPESVNISKSVDPMGTIAWVEDGNGYTTNYSYDGLDRPTVITYPIHSSMAIGWNTNTINATRGAYTEITTLDGLGRPVNINHSGISVSYQYDPLGHKVFESYPCSGSSCGTGRNFAVDVLGRVTEVNNNGATRLFDYNSGGTVDVTTERDYQLTYVYQSYGDPDERMLTSLTTPTTSTSATYYANGLLHTISQGGLTRTYGYNDNWFLTSSADPETGTTTFGRDAIGNLSSVQVGSGGTTSYQYDGLNRKYSISSNAPTSSTTGPVAAPATAIQYDYDSNVWTLNAGCTNITYHYDQLDELKSEEHQDICGGPDLTAGYGYDNLDHLSSTTYPSGTTINYAPDVWGRPTTAGSYVSNATYWPNGTIQNITFGNGATEQQTLTSRQLVYTLLAKTSAGTSFANLNYGYDDANNVDSLTDAVTPANSLSGWTYDGDDQLTAVSGSFGNAGAQYDGLGNVRTLNLGSGGNFTFGYNNNQLQSVSGSKSYTVSYDGQGNATSDGGYQYIYDSENRTVSVSIAAQGMTRVRRGLKH